jgi:hypothetical protein
MIRFLYGVVWYTSCVLVLAAIGCIQYVLGELLGAAARTIVLVMPRVARCFATPFSDTTASQQSMERTLVAQDVLTRCAHVFNQR